MYNCYCLQQQSSSQPSTGMGIRGKREHLAVLLCWKNFSKPVALVLSSKKLSALLHTQLQTSPPSLGKAEFEW